MITDYLHSDCWLQHAKKHLPQRPSNLGHRVPPHCCPLLTWINKIIMFLLEIWSFEAYLGPTETKPKVPKFRFKKRWKNVSIFEVLADYKLLNVLLVFKLSKDTKKILKASIAVFFPAGKTMVSFHFSTYINISNLRPLPPCSNRSRCWPEWPGA